MSINKNSPEVKAFKAMALFHFTSPETYFRQIAFVKKVLRSYDLDLEEETLDDIAHECIQEAYLAAIADGSDTGPSQNNNQE